MILESEIVKATVSDHHTILLQAPKNPDPSKL